MLSEISARRSLLEPSFIYMLPGREGEKCRSLDHVWQIPFIHQLSSHPILRSTYIYIQNCSNYFFHVVFALYLETLSTCHLRMHPSRTTYFEVQRHFGVILSSMWCVLVRDSATQSETLPLKLDTDGSQNGVDAFNVRILRVHERKRY